MPPPAKLVRMPQRFSGTDQKRMLAEIRASLPLTEYLSVLHTLALTGMVPCYDPPAAPNLPPVRNGQFTPPDRQLQVKTLTFLIDKAFAPIERPAAVRAADAVTDDPAARLIETPAEARTLTVGELIRRLSPPPPEPDPAPDPAPAHADPPADAP